MLKINKEKYIELLRGEYFVSLGTGKSTIEQAENMILKRNFHWADINTNYINLMNRQASTFITYTQFRGSENVEVRENIKGNYYYAEDHDVAYLIHDYKNGTISFKAYNLLPWRNKMVYCQRAV